MPVHACRVRPKDADSKDTWNRIIASANELLETKSATEISLRSVSAHAGVSTGTLTYYFKNKEALLEAVLEEYYTRLSAMAMALIQESAGETDARAVLERATRRLYKFHWDERTVMRLRSSTRILRGELPECIQQRFLRQFAGAAAKAISELTGASERRARFAVQTVTHLIMRYVLCSDSELSQALGDEVTRDEVEDHIVEVALTLAYPSPLSNPVSS